jgi:hypothetical protein
MNLIEVFALISLAALTLSAFMCLWINRRNAVRAERMMRCLDVAVRQKIRAT